MYDPRDNILSYIGDPVSASLMDTGFDDGSFGIREIQGC